MSYKHGHASGGKVSSLYSVWDHMKTRCTNPRAEGYASCGARGITVCQEWLDFSAFSDWANRNGFKPGLALSRIDSKAGYSPANCRFVDKSRDNPTNALPVTALGETKPCKAWASDARCLVRLSLLRWRIEHRWNAEDAITLPVGSSERPNWIWTADREAHLHELVAQVPRPRIDAMARELGLSYHAVSHHIAKLGLGQPKYNHRTARRRAPSIERPRYYGRAPTLPVLDSLRDAE